MSGEPLRSGRGCISNQNGPKVLEYKIPFSSHEYRAFMQDNIFASQKRRGKYLFLPQMDTRQ